MTKASDPGPRPELKFIDKDKLYVDSDYQRQAGSNASKRNIEYMRLNFSWAYFGALVVCYVKEKKQYAIIDGQHRFLVVKSLSAIDQIPCVVVSNPEVERQAQSFMAINTKRVQLNSLAAFHAAVAAGDKTAASIKEILDECQVQIPRNPVMASQLGARQLQSPGTLASLVGRYSRKHICWALKIIPEAFGEKSGILRAQLIKALTQIAKATPELDHGRMVKVLSGLDPFQLEADARAYVTIGGGTSLAAMVEALTRLYKNAGRKNAA